MFRSSSLRLAALYTAVFALSVVILGFITVLTTRHALAGQVDARIRIESSALAQEYLTEGLKGVVQAVAERDSTPGALDYGVVGPKGEALAGRLTAARAPDGWSVLKIRERDGDVEPIRILNVPLGGGLRLLIGDDLERVEALDSAVLQGFAWAFAGVVILGVAGGFALSRGVGRRLAAISGTAEAIIDGDFASRVPVRGDSDDLDRLSLTVNRMLDRISTLMESLRQVSSDVAHDLRTPLTRLRQKLETSLRDPTARDAVIESALLDLDAILDTFAALLRIAQIEGGARRAAFRPTDLTAVARTVVEAFAPSAEDATQTLALEAEGPAIIDGDPELLTQMLVNLVENALRHTGQGAAIRVRIDAGPEGVVLAVIDNGPGVPDPERDKLFDRFYRLERSRSTPGSGLGLALVAAVTRLHGAEIRLLDAAPGLQARVTFHAAG